MSRTSAWGSPNSLSIARELLQDPRSAAAVVLRLLLLSRAGGLRRCSDHPNASVTTWRQYNAAENILVSCSWAATVTHVSVNVACLPWLSKHNSASLFRVSTIRPQWLCEKLCMWLCARGIDSFFYAQYVLSHLPVLRTSETSETFPTHFCTFLYANSFHSI